MLIRTDFISRTSELARIFGILFFSVISRGSQVNFLVSQSHDIFKDVQLDSFAVLKRFKFLTKNTYLQLNSIHFGINFCYSSFVLKV